MTVVVVCGGGDAHCRRHASVERMYLARVMTCCRNVINVTVND